MTIFVSRAAVIGLQQLSPMSDVNAKSEGGGISKGVRWLFLEERDKIEGIWVDGGPFSSSQISQIRENRGSVWKRNHRGNKKVFALMP